MVCCKPRRPLRLIDRFAESRSPRGTPCLELGYGESVDGSART